MVTFYLRSRARDSSSYLPASRWRDARSNFHPRTSFTWAHKHTGLSAEIPPARLRDPRSVIWSDRFGGSGDPRPRVSFPLDSTELPISWCFSFSSFFFLINHNAANKILQSVAARSQRTLYEFRINSCYLKLVSWETLGFKFKAKSEFLS